MARASDYSLIVFIYPISNLIQLSYFQANSDHQSARLAAAMRELAAARGAREEAEQQACTRTPPLTTPTGGFVFLRVDHNARHTCPTRCHTKCVDGVPHRMRMDATLRHDVCTPRRTKRARRNSKRERASYWFGSS